MFAYIVSTVRTIIHDLTQIVAVISKEDEPDESNDIGENPNLPIVLLEKEQELVGPSRVRVRQQTHSYLTTQFN